MLIKVVNSMKQNWQVTNEYVLAGTLDTPKFMEVREAKNSYYLSQSFNVKIKDIYTNSYLTPFLLTWDIIFAHASRPSLFM